MVKFFDKCKEVANGTKDKFVPTKNEAKDMAKSSASSSRSLSKKYFEEGAVGTETVRKNDPMTEYRRNKPMTPAKIIEHGPTAAVKEIQAIRR